MKLAYPVAMCGPLVQRGKRMVCQHCGFSFTAGSQDDKERTTHTWYHFGDIDSVTAILRAGE